MADQFHLLISSDDAGPLAICYGPKRSECEIVLMVNQNYQHYKLTDVERGKLCQKLVDAANKSLT